MKNLTQTSPAVDLKPYRQHLQKNGPHIRKLAHQAALVELRDYPWMELNAATAWKVLAMLPREP